eukprot:1009149_1
MSEFTMVFIDLDNTMIPSRMHKVIHYQLGFDIYRTLSSTLLKKLQYSIIKALDHIRIVIEQKYHQQACFAIVSNANSEWIRHRIEYSPHGKRPVFPILAKYLNANHIDFYSAMDEMYHWLSCRYGAESATDMFNDMHSAKNTDDTMQKWIWKYTTFSAILLKYKQQKHKTCARIISIGDGDEEAVALANYAPVFDTVCDHIHFIDTPTIEQLQEQWKYIEDHFVDILNRKDEQKYRKHNLRQIFVSNNNQKCTGSSHQLTAIGTYFQLWMDDLEERVCVQYKNEAMRQLATRCDERIHSGKPTKHLKKMIAHLRENKEFDDVWRQNMEKRNVLNRNPLWMQIRPKAMTIV